MRQYISDVTAVSSKGQVVLPKAIRDMLRIEPGVNLMVLSDGSNNRLKPIPAPDITESDDMMNASAAWASDVGMTEDDITSAIQTVRMP